MDSVLVCQRRVVVPFLLVDARRVASVCACSAWPLETIRSNEEISNIFSHGKRASNRFITFIYDGSSSEHDHFGRVAFIAGKRNGNAVWRNSAKRRMREIYRALNGEWKKYDILFVAKPPLLRESYSKVLSACDKTLKNIHGWSSEYVQEDRTPYDEDSFIRCDRLDHALSDAHLTVVAIKLQVRTNLLSIWPQGFQTFRLL